VPIHREYEYGWRAMRETFKLTKRALAVGRRIRVEAVRGPNEATQRVRDEVYRLEKRYVTSDSLFDCYDLRATILNVFEGNEPVGTMRITDNADGQLELFEMHPELEALAPSGCRYVEFSRLMVIRRCRGLRATLPLFREAILRSLPTHDVFVLSCVKDLVPYYNRLFGFRLLSEQPLIHRRMHGVVDYPMIVGFPEALRHLSAPIWLALSPSVFALASRLKAVRYIEEASRKVAIACGLAKRSQSAPPIAVRGEQWGDQV
jgi:hypothetical protein